MIKTIYGLTVEQFDELLASQGGACAICGKPADLTPGVRTDQWNIDHCHETGAVRGILCSPCNIGIGQLGDDPARLRAALRYLEEYLGKQG